MSTEIVWRDREGTLLSTVADLDLVIQKSYEPGCWHGFIGVTRGIEYSTVFNVPTYPTAAAARAEVEAKAVEILAERVDKRTTLKARLAEARDAYNRADSRVSELTVQLIATESALKSIADLCEQASVTAADESTRAIFEMLRATAEGV